MKLIISKPPKTKPTVGGKRRVAIWRVGDKIIIGYLDEDG